MRRIPLATNLILTALAVHWLRFRATSPAATPTLSDRTKTGEPGGPAGQQTMVNFVEIQPVLEMAK